MAVSFAVLCSSTRTANYELLIMMPSDNYYMNQDGVVHHDYFVFHNVSSFSAIIRKLVYSLLCSLRDSNNLLVCAMLHSDICLQSSQFERWHKLLHVF